MGHRLYISKHRIPNVTWTKINKLKDVERIILKEGIDAIDAISFGDEDKGDCQPIIGYWWILRFLSGYARENNYLPRLKIHAKSKRHRILLTRAISYVTSQMGDQ